MSAKILSISSTDCSITSDDNEPKDEFTPVIADRCPVLINQETLDEMVLHMKLTKDNAHAEVQRKTHDMSGTDEGKNDFCLSFILLKLLL